MAIVGFIAVLAYQKSIKGTFDIYRECKRLESEIIKSDELVQQLPQLRQKLNDVNFIVKENKENGQLSIQQQLLGIISDFSISRKIKLETLDAIHFYKENNYIISTQCFTLEGDFKSALVLLDYIEINFDLSHVSSVNYYTKQNYNSAKKEFYAKIYLQKIAQL